MAYSAILGQKPKIPDPAPPTAAQVSYSNASTSDIIGSNNVQGALDNLAAYSRNLFTSVSNGKNQIASAITGKGISASGSESFASLAGKIGQLQVQNAVDINSTPVWETYKIMDGSTANFQSTYTIPEGTTVVGVSWHTGSQQTGCLLFLNARIVTNTYRAPNPYNDYRAQQIISTYPSIVDDPPGFNPNTRTLYVYITNRSNSTLWIKCW